MCFRATTVQVVHLVYLGKLAMDSPVPRSLSMSTFVLHKLMSWMFARLDLHFKSDF